MNKMVVVVFGNQTEASKGLIGLKELHAEGTITLYFSAIAVKDNLGIVSMKNMEGRGAVGTFDGMAIGSLIGLLGGPAGFAIGAFAGSMTGLLYDMTKAGVNSEFIDDVSDAMKPGSVTLIAEIDEELFVPLDTKMEESHGLVFRRLRKEVENEELVREISLHKEEMEHLNSELNAADEETRSKIEKSLLRTKKKLKILQKRAHTKPADAKNEYVGKVSTLDDQIKDAKESKKAKITKKREALTHDYETDTEKLKEAAETVKKTLIKE